MSLLTKSEDQGTILTQGSFVGDVDKLISAEDSSHATSLVCHQAGSVFFILKHDLQGFLLENPGILMSLSGKMYVR
jgi:hypothetical protein